MNKLSSDTSGAAFLEFTLVFPLVLLVTLGAVDVALLSADWLQAHKVTYAGARQAIVENPVSGAITWTYSVTASPGDSCYDSSGNSSGACTTVVNKRCYATTVSAGVPTAGQCCTPSGSSCGSAVAWSASDLQVFKNILAKMNAVHPVGALDPRQVQIEYQSSGRGFAYSPTGQPLNVTVSIRCMTHEFYFLNGLVGWAMPTLSSDCSGIPAGRGPIMPPLSTTLPSEDLDSTNNT